MDNNETRYWFNLSSETFLWHSKENVLLYNTEEQKSLFFENSAELSHFVAQLQDINNLYCIELTQPEIEGKALNAFVEKTVRYRFGNIQEAIEGERKPAFFVPVLKLQNKMKKIDHFVKDNNNMLSYLHEVTIHLNEIYKNANNLLSEQGQIRNIPIGSLIPFLKTFKKNSSLSSINICGDKLIEYPSIERLIFELSDNNIKKIFHLPLGQFMQGVERILSFNTKPFQIIVLLPTGIESKFFSQAYRKSCLLDVDVLWKFNIICEEDYLKAENIIDEFKLMQFMVTPIFNGRNHAFFEDVIYLNEEDIQMSQLSKREIFAHQTLNTNYFGRLTIKANGRVYAGSFYHPIGTINDPINDMLCKELNSNSSWLKIRDMKPCRSCVYQWLCPSPGDYELAIGKPNLCTVKG